MRIFRFFRFTISAFFLFFSFESQGQSKVFLSKLDTSYIAPSIYYITYDWQGFFISDLSTREFDVYNYNPDLLSATVFFTINKMRASKKMEPFKYSPELASVAYNYIQLNSSRKFVYNRDNWKRIVKTLPKVCDIFGFKGALVTANISNPYAINYKGNRKFYYDKKDTKTTLKLFYGKKPEGSEKSELRNAIAPFTYEAFANNFLRKWQGTIGNRNTRSKAYEYMACYLAVDPKTLNRNKIPRVKAIIIFGGYRVNMDK